jgi:hypothetical protein
LPRRSIERAQVLGKIDFEKNPAFAHLGAGRDTSLCAPAQFLRMHLQEVRSLEKGKRLHFNCT